MIVLQKVISVSEVVDYRYIGRGEHVPIFKDKPEIRRLNFSNQETPALLHKAHEFAKQEGWIVITGPDAWERAKDRHHDQ